MPAASLVVLATILTSLGMPIDGIAILIGVYRFMDMGRTEFNVIGNSVAAIMVANGTVIIKLKSNNSEAS